MVGQYKKGAVPHQRLVPVLGSRARYQDHRRERAAGFGPGEGAGQRVAAVGVRVGHVLCTVRERLLRVLRSARRGGGLRIAVGSFVGNPLQVQRQRVAQLCEGALDRRAVFGERALEGAPDRRHRHGHVGPVRRHVLRRDGGVALVHGEESGSQAARVVQGQLKAHPQLDAGTRNFYCAFPGADELLHRRVCLARVGKLGPEPHRTPAQHREKGQRRHQGRRALACLRRRVHLCSLLTCEPTPRFPFQRDLPVPAASCAWATSGSNESAGGLGRCRSRPSPSSLPPPRPPPPALPRGSRP